MINKNIKIEDLIEQKPISSSNNILQFIEGKTIFVTGGAGSIGSEIVLQLAKYNPRKLVVIDQAETPVHNLILKMEESFSALNFYPMVCDIRNKKALNQLFRSFNPDIIYHCAAYKHVPLMEINPSEAVLVNIMGTKILADLAIKNNAKHFVLISTDKAVNPSSLMGATKRVAEMYTQYLHHFSHNKKDTKFIITRFGNVLGSNGSVFSLFKEQIEQGGPLTITHPQVTRYFIAVSEVCELIIEASSIGLGGETFIFDMGKAVKIIDLANKMIGLTGLTPEKDIKIKEIGLRQGEKLHEELFNKNSSISTTSHEKIKVVKEINYKFDSVEKELDKVISIAKKYKSNKIVKKIKKLVPEYKSLNFQNKKLDK